MRPQDFIICSDFDDTINRLVPNWVNWLNEHYGFDVKYEDIKNWDMSIAYPELTISQICAPLKNREFWKTVDMKPDAVYYVNKLIEEGFQFYLVTASAHTTIQAKVEECLLRYFPNFDNHNIITTYHKHLIKCNVLIDDYVPNLINSNAVKILMNAPHNVNSCNIEDFRVSSWKEIYEIVHQLLIAMNT